MFFYIFIYFGVIYAKTGDNKMYYRLSHDAEQY